MSILPNLLCSVRVRALAFSQVLRDLLERKAIEDARGRHAALAGHFDPPVSQVELADRMGIGVDAHQASKFECALVPAPVEIEPPRMGIDLDSDPVPRTGSKDFLDIHLVARTSEQLASGHVTEDSRVGIGDRPEYAFRLGLGIQLEAAVDARDHEIKLRQYLVWIIQRAVDQNIRLDPFEDAKILAVSLVQKIDSVVLPLDLLYRKTACVMGGFGMVGNAEILIAALLRCLRHGFERVHAV